MEKTSELQGKVGKKFLVGTAISWLSLSLPAPSFTEYIKVSSQEAIKDLEIWVPLFRVYCAYQFSIGPVTFRPISEQIMEAFFNGPGRPALDELAKQC
jgi:hypothetical protein